MTHRTQFHAIRLTATAPAGTGLMARLRGHFSRLHEARAGQARLAALTPDTLGDTRLSPEELTGAPSYDPALPFFMQANFGRHDR